MSGGKPLQSGSTLCVRRFLGRRRSKMDELTSLGLILLLALLAGHLVKVIRVPEVTGYILAGIALGPSVLGWVTADNLAALEVLSEVALGLILFSIGSVFEFSRFRRMGRQILYLTLIESVLAAVLVTGGGRLPWGSRGKSQPSWVPWPSRRHLRPH